MQRFSLDRGRFAGHPRRGFPHPSGGSPSPSKSPPEGGDPTPRGAGACRPPVRPLASPSTPLGHPYGVPPAILAGSPSRLCSAMERDGQAKRAGAAAPEKGLKKIKVVAPIAAAGRQRWKCGEGRAAGGQGWGQPVGSPRAVHGVSLLLSTGREAPAGRVAISTSPPPGVQLGPLWGPVVRSEAASGLSVLGRQRLQPEKCPVVLARQR